MRLNERTLPLFNYLCSSLSPLNKTTQLWLSWTSCIFFGQLILREMKSMITTDWLLKCLQEEWKSLKSLFVQFFLNTSVLAFPDFPNDHFHTFMFLQQHTWKSCKTITRNWYRLRKASRTTLEDRSGWSENSIKLSL